MIFLISLIYETDFNLCGHVGVPKMNVDNLKCGPYSVFFLTIIEYNTRNKDANTYNF
jgi:hypothetical protein